jgi:hypothetical protein
MKKWIYSILLVCMLFANIYAKNVDVICEINKKVSSLKSYHFISLSMTPKVVFGTIFICKPTDKLYESALVWSSISDKTAWKLSAYNLTDFNLKTVQNIHYLRNGTNIKKTLKITTNPKKYYNTLTWSNNPNGIAISTEYVNGLQYREEQIINEQHWKSYIGDFDLAKTENILGSQQGALYLWYALDKQAVVELYTDTTKKPLVIRKLYLDNKEIFKDEPRDNPESLVKMFMTLYEKAGFSEFMATLK